MQKKSQAWSRGKIWGRAEKVDARGPRKNRTFTKFYDNANIDDNGPCMQRVGRIKN